MENEKYFVVDVTTLLKWNRSPVGIIRTQLEFTNYVLNSTEDTLYFKFNDSKDNLSLVDKEDVQRKVEQLLNFKHIQVEPRVESIKTTRVINKYLVLLKKIVDIYKYEGVRSLLIKVCKWICLPRLKKIAKKLYIKLLSNRPTTPKHEEQFQDFSSLICAPEIHLAAQLTPHFLKENAIVISMGLDWDNSNYPMLFWLKNHIGFEFVGSFYDGIPVINPELVQSYYFSQKFFSHLYYLIHLSDRVFCISDYSKNQMVSICHQHNIQNVPRLKTVHLGDSVYKKKGKLEFAPRKHKKDYVLYVSTIETRKNHLLLLKVWQKLQREVCDLPDLVFVGMMGWGVDELLDFYRADRNLQGAVHFYHDVHDEELVSIYQNSKFTVFPSFVEGWGLGAVESMLYGKPCIISNCDALLEATQGLMPSASPANIDEWSEIIKEFSNNENTLISYKKVIHDKFKSRTWNEFSEDFAQFAKGEK